MKHALIVVGILTVLLQQATLRADDAPSTPAANADLILLPSPTITLEYGEHIDLSVFDNRNQVAPSVGTVTWTVNDEPMGQIDASHGSLALPADNVSGTAVTYTTPPKQSLKKHITVTATISSNGALTKLTADLVIVPEPNWFSIDGDTGIGQQNVTIQLDPNTPSAAGVGAIPLGIAKNDFIGHIVGTKKGSPNSSLTVDINMAQNSQPGTYSWVAGRSFVGVVIVLYGDKKNYVSIRLNAASKFGSLPGTTTIMKPDPTDPPGLMKGCYSGQLMWVDVVNRKFAPHLLTVRGHFALSGK